MLRKKLTDAQIVLVIRESENGATVEEVCQKLGAFDATTYNWKKRFAGMATAEV